MLTSIVITGRGLARNRKITLPLQSSVIPSSYFIANVDGLGPVKATVSTSTYPDLDGDNIQSTRVGGRNLVITLGLTPNYGKNEDPQSLRQDLYRIVPPKSEVDVVINDTKYPQVTFTGTVEDLATTIFNKNPAIQISILSEAAYLTDTTVIQDKMYAMNSTFNLNYSGSAETGFEIEPNFTKAAGNLSVVLNGMTVFRVVYAFAPGDKLDLITIARQKQLILTRGTTKISLLDNITVGDLNMVLGPAIDTFGVYTDTGSTTPYALTYSPMYIGI